MTSEHLEMRSLQKIFFQLESSSGGLLEKDTKLKVSKR